MIFSFDPSEGLIVVHAEIIGPKSTAILRIAPATGATRTLINTRIRTVIGYDPATAAEKIEVTTGSSVEYSPLVAVAHIACLGLIRKDMKILSHTLPPSTGVDGLLGLDFLRTHKRVLDFQAGTIELLPSSV